MNRTIRNTAFAFAAIACIGTAHAQLFGNQPSLPPWHDPNEVQPGLVFGSNPNVGPAPIHQSDITPSAYGRVTRLPDGSVQIDANVPAGTIFYGKGR